MEDKVINLNEQLNGIEKLFASGQIKKAQKDLRKLNSQFGREKPIPQKFRHKFQNPLWLYSALKIFGRLLSIQLLSRKDLHLPSVNILLPGRHNNY